MHRSWLITSSLLLAALAVPSWASEPSSPPVAVCPVTQATDEVPLLPQDGPAPLFATGYLCGTCSDPSCSGLMSGSQCGVEESSCLALVNASTHQPVYCQPPDPGVQCIC